MEANGHIYAHITCTRVKWEQDVSVLAEAEGVSLDEIRQRYSIGWHVDGRTGEVEYDDDGSGDYIPSSDVIRMEDPVEEHGWIDRSWSATTLHENRNDVLPIVDCTLSDPETLFDEVKDALEWLEGGYENNGDGTFYSADSRQPYDEPWNYSYAIHFVRKFLGKNGWTEEPWLDAEELVKRDGHVDYPHEPGRMYDCWKCESECYCGSEEGETSCIHCTINA